MRAFFPSKLSREQITILNKQGITPVTIPLIKTVSLPFPAEIVEIFRPDFIVFSSKNGVKHFFSRISVDHIQNTKVIAVGKSTAKLLKDRGIEPLIPESFSGEGLIELIKKNKLKGKFLLIKPKKARNLLPEFLKKEGNIVQEVIAYETVTNTEAADEMAREVAKGFEIATFTSPSTFKSFLKLSGEKGKQLLRKTKIIPIGHVTAEAIQKTGFKVWKLPQEYTLNGIIKLIIEYGGKR
ncbi:uroporphyrinogen-III synthase [Desulfurobacterium indicum]|uniref:Uroporphyrinogen-III synthase n=1 Tax=Desulfurobacterium indicum TaxID=1914305 RepID=A0A1R1MN17_9BACT|nr:uroporphyrinogen-III synthase [Desulfurobacterium indicum]OMH41166.1 uroporphyrinogen III synthase [Desulfurobacterium indicum]